MGAIETALIICICVPFLTHCVFLFPCHSGELFLDQGSLFFSSVPRAWPGQEQKRIFPRFSRVISGCHLFFLLLLRRKWKSWWKNSRSSCCGQEKRDYAMSNGHKNEFLLYILLQFHFPYIKDLKFGESIFLWWLCFSAQKNEVNEECSRNLMLLSADCWWC